MNRDLPRRSCGPLIRCKLRDPRGRKNLSVRDFLDLQKSCVIGAPGSGAVTRHRGGAAINLCAEPPVSVSTMRRKKFVECFPSHTRINTSLVYFSASTKYH